MSREPLALLGQEPVVETIDLRLSAAVDHVVNDVVAGSAASEAIRVREEVVRHQVAHFDRAWQDSVFGDAFDSLFECVEQLLDVLCLPKLLVPFQARIPAFQVDAGSLLVLLSRHALGDLVSDPVGPLLVRIELPQSLGFFVQLLDDLL